MNVQEKVKIFIEKQGLIREGDKVLLGLSGGADSVCLFYLLLAIREELGFTLRTAHVHHGIREEAGEDAAFAAALSEGEGVPCYLFREDVPAFAKEQGLSEEEAGRMLRYRDFRECLKRWEEESFGQDAFHSSFKIATAHHENDQAETVLFQLFRGSGLTGLRGILPQRGDIIRPLLCLSRAEIEDYLRDRGAAWREDRTNALPNYSRNKIRHQILPYVEREICPQAAAHIGNTARIVREAECYIRSQASAACRRVVAEREDILVFDIASLLREDVFLQKQILLHGLERILPTRKDIGAVHVEDMLELTKKQGNGELCLPGGVRARKVYGKLLLYPKEREREAEKIFLSQDRRGFLTGERKPEITAERIDLSDGKAVKERLGIRDISEIIDCIPQKTYTKWFDYDKIETSFSVRHCESGDYLTIDERMNRKSLRRYMIENKIPASERRSIWLIADDTHVMWVPGGRTSDFYKVTGKTKTILQIRICGRE